MVIKVPDLLQQKGSYLQGFLEFTVNMSDNQSDAVVKSNRLSLRIFSK